MPQLFLILLKINVVLVLFSIAYYTLLRKLTFYKLNRFFLLLGMVFATVYPFINLTAFIRFTAPESKLRIWVPQVKDQLTLLMEARIAQLWTLAECIFYAGLLVMSIRLMMQLVSLYRVHRKSFSGEINNFRVRILKEKISPFTFWQNIYINPEIHAKQELENILEHEQIHVKQWHTVDILLAEISLVFYWFNPGVWLMKKAVKENLEFITDQKILTKGIDPKAYQYSLLGASTAEMPVALVSHFNLNDLKKRIVMMNKKRSSRFNLFLYAFVVPCLLMLTLAFTFDKTEVKSKVKNIVGIKDVTPVVPSLQIHTETSAKKLSLNPKKRSSRTVAHASVDEKNTGVREIEITLRDTAERKPKKISFIYTTSFNTGDGSLPDSMLKSLEGKVKSIMIKKVLSSGISNAIVGQPVVQINTIDTVHVLAGKPVVRRFQLRGNIDPKEIKNIVVTGSGTQRELRIETSNLPKN